ncbi:MAG TPA: hypothetical protein VKR79_11290 [Gaiellaceae bacterium]|nr:hypothetical protein [Gaiellaceae bacterium]
MRTRNSLERLAAAGRPLFSEADSLVDEAEEHRILTRILAADRVPGTVHRRRRAALVLVGVAVLVAAATVASLETGTGSAPSTRTTGHHKVALSGRTIQLAGYNFRLPAGYSSGACEPPATQTPGSPNTVIHSMQSAASADGGCIGVAILARSWTPPSNAQNVSVGSYDGFFVPGSPTEGLFVEIPVSQGDQYLVVSAEGLNEAQLIAIAESGLPANATAGTETG